jgi:hypothetical protein
MLPRAITVQLNAVEALQEQSMLTHAASAQKDADTIVKALRNIISLCDVFQVSFSSYCHKLCVYTAHFLQIDTQLNIDITVGKVIEVQGSCYSKEYKQC